MNCTASLYSKITRTFSDFKLKRALRNDETDINIKDAFNLNSFQFKGNKESDDDKRILFGYVCRLLTPF